MCPFVCNQRQQVFDNEKFGRDNFSRTKTISNIRVPLGCVVSKFMQFIRKYQNLASAWRLGTFFILYISTLNKKHANWILIKQCDNFMHGRSEIAKSVTKIYLRSTLGVLLPIENILALAWINIVNSHRILKLLMIQHTIKSIIPTPV